MTDILSNKEIREICLANGFSLKQQPAGEMDLNPYVYSAASALIEAGLRATLASGSRSRHVVLKKGPSAALDIPQYNDFGSQHTRDWVVLSELADRLQASIVQRCVSSTKLWNISVVDKHAGVIAGALGMRLGAAMHSCIADLRKAVAEAETVPNEPFFPDPVIDDLQKTKRLKIQGGLLTLDQVAIEVPGNDDMSELVRGVATHPLYNIVGSELITVENEDKWLTLPLLLICLKPPHERYMVSPVFGHYERSYGSEWAWDAENLNALSSHFRIPVTCCVGDVPLIKIGEVTFRSANASSLMRVAVCYLLCVIVKNVDWELTQC